LLMCRTGRNPVACCSYLLIQSHLPFRCKARNQPPERSECSHACRARFNGDRHPGLNTQIEECSHVEDGFPGNVITNDSRQSFEAGNGNQVIPDFVPVKVRIRPSQNHGCQLCERSHEPSANFAPDSKPASVPDSLDGKP
jgi:hypothetical protein